MEILLEYLKVLTATPVLFFGFVLFIAFRYKVNVAAFFDAIINRLGSIEVSGLGKIAFQSQKNIEERQKTKSPEEKLRLERNQSKYPDLEGLTDEELKANIYV